MTSSGCELRKESTGTMVWWDLQTVPPPPNHQFMHHLLASHRAMRSGLFSLSPPVTLRAHGTEPLAKAAYDYIIESKLVLQQSISSGSEQGSTRCWKAMVVDMLLWATDHAPGKADVIIISKVLDRSMADVIHQLHLRNYNIMVSTSFPPKDMTPLRGCDPPLNCKLLRQIFPHCDNSLSNTADVSPINTNEEVLIRNGNHEEAAICATNSLEVTQESLSQVSTLCSQIAQNCKNVIEEFLQEGITEFLEYDLYAFFRIRHGERLDYKKAGFETLDKFLEFAVPGVNFRSIVVGTKYWICCSRPGQESRILRLQETRESTRLIPNMIENMRVRQSIQLSDIARPKISTQGKLCYGPLTIEEVRNWLEELVACGRADTGINLSLLGKDFEDHKGKKLNFKSLHCPTLTVLLSKFEYLVRLERKDSMVILFPSNMPSKNGSRPTNMPEIGNLPLTRPRRLFCPPTNCTLGVSMRPPAYISLPRIVQGPGLISIRKNIPTPEPVPKFSVTLNTTVRAPTTNTVNTVIRPKKFAPSASEVKIDPARDQASEENHRPSANRLPDGESYIKCQELPKVKQISTPSNTPAAALEPESRQASMTSEAPIKPTADPVRLPNTAPPATSEIKIELADGNLHLDTGVPPSGTAKVSQAPGGEDTKQTTNGGAGSDKKFDFYSLKVVQEREAIKRTFESVNKRLQEEFKKRRIAQQPVSGESNQATT